MKPAPPVTRYEAIVQRSCAKAEPFRLWASGSAEEPRDGQSPGSNPKAFYDGRPTSRCGERGSRELRYDAHRVRVIQFPQRLVGQADAVQLPERVVVAVVVEVLIVGLEHPPVV